MNRLFNLNRFKDLFNFHIFDDHFEYKNQLNRIINAKKRIFLNNNKDNFKNIQNKTYLNNIYKLLNGKGLCYEDANMNSTGYLQYDKSYNMLDSEYTELIQYLYPKLQKNCFNFIIKEYKYKYCYNNNNIIISPLYTISPLQKDIPENKDYDEEKHYLFLEEAILHLNEEYKYKIYKPISGVLYCISFILFILGCIFTNFSSTDFIYFILILALVLFILSFSLTKIITNNIINKFSHDYDGCNNISKYTDKHIISILNKYEAINKFTLENNVEKDQNKLEEDNKVILFTNNLETLKKQYNIINKKIGTIEEINNIMKIVNNISDYIISNNITTPSLLMNFDVNITSLNDIFKILIKNNKYKTNKNEDLEKLCIDNIKDFTKILQYNYELMINEDKDYFFTHLKVMKINNDEYVKYLNLKND